MNPTMMILAGAAIFIVVVMVVLLMNSPSGGSGGGGSSRAGQGAVHKRLGALSGGPGGGAARPATGGGGAGSATAIRSRLQSSASTAVLKEEELFEADRTRAGQIRYDLSEKIAYRLAQANIPFRVGQYVLGTSIAGIAIGIFLAWYMGPTWFFAGLGVGAGLGVVYINSRLKKRVKAFMEMFPDSLDLLASSLRTGQALPTALSLVADEMAEPVKSEFAKVVHEMNLGLPESEALQNMNERVNSVDVQMFVTSVLVQKEIGGNLAELLDTIAGTIRQRFKIMGQVEAYTAQARFSGRILIGLPIVLGALIQALRPGYLDPLLFEDAGKGMLRFAAISWVLGFFTIRSIVNIKI